MERQRKVNITPVGDEWSNTKKTELYPENERRRIPLVIGSYKEVAELKQTTPIPCSSIFFHFNWFTRSGVLFSFHRCQAIFASFEWNKVN